MAKEYWLKFGTGNPADTVGLSPTFIVFKSWTGGVVSPPGITAPIASYGLYRFEYTPSFPIVFVADGATTGLSSSSRYLTGALDPLDLMDERLSEVGSTLTAVGNTVSTIGLTLIPSLGVSVLAQGNTLLGYASTLTGFGVTSVALGNTSVALGTTNGLNIIAYGSTHFGQGSTLLGYASTLLGYGASIYAQGLSGGADVSEVLARLGTTASSYGSTSVDPGSVYGYLKRLQEVQEGDASFDKSTGVWSIQTRGGTLLQTKTLTNTSSAVTKT